MLFQISEGVLETTKVEYKKIKYDLSLNLTTENLWYTLEEHYEDNINIKVITTDARVVILVYLKDLDLYVEVRDVDKEELDSLSPQDIDEITQRIEVARYLINDNIHYE